MAHTREQRSARALCAATKKNGESCRAFAGQGTDHPGIGRCRYHLGNTPTHRASAAVKEAELHVARFGGPIALRPHEALLSMLHLATGHVAFLREALNDVDSLSSDEGRAIVGLYGSERDRVAKVAKAALDAGVQERQVRLAESYGRALATLLRSVFDDPELGLTTKQRSRLPEVLRAHLGRLEAGGGLEPAA